MQTSYSNSPGRMMPGMSADSRIMKHDEARVCVGPVKVGVVGFRVPGYGGIGQSPEASPGLIYQSPSPAVAVDVDAILATGASAASIATFDSGDADGVVGTGVMYPARKLTVTLSASADWDATTSVITYVDEDGATVSENLTVPNGGNATLTTTGYAVQFVSLVNAAQSGTGGTFTIGVAVLDSIDFQDVAGIVMRDRFQVAATEDAEFADKDLCDIRVKGAIVVEYEGSAPTPGDKVYFRTSSGSGGSQLGALRKDTDSDTAAEYVGARWGRVSGTMAVVEIL